MGLVGAYKGTLGQDKLIYCAVGQSLDVVIGGVIIVITTCSQGCTRFKMKLYIFLYGDTSRKVHTTTWNDDLSTTRGMNSVNGLADY